RKKAELSTQHKMRAFIEGKVMDRLLKSPVEEQLQIFEVINTKGFFVPTKKDDPFAEMCAETRTVDQDEWIAHNVGGLCSLLDFDNRYVKELFTDRSTLEKELTACADKKTLPPKMTITEGVLEPEGEMEIETEVETEQEQELELELELELEMHTDAQSPPE